MRKSIILAVAGIGSICAQVSSQTAPAFKQLVVNGRSLQAKVLDIEGKHFVAVEDLAQSLGGTVGYDGEKITLTFLQPSLPKPSEPENGRVRGTLTYFFNVNFGNKPDTGSEVWLVEGHLDIPSTVIFISLGDRLIVGKDKPKIIKYSTADGSGNFDLLDIPTGQYTLILKSNHAKGQAQRDVDGLVKLRNVQIKKGETLDASMDFGVTAF